MESNNSQTLTKIDFIVIGNHNSGKTSLINTFTLSQSNFNQMYTATIGLNLEKKIINLKKNNIQLYIWDTAGQERYFAVTKNYFKRADGIIFIYDVTNRESFQQIENYWIPQIYEKAKEKSVKILVGNKSDLTDAREISYSEGKSLSRKYNLQFFETSAKTGQRVQEIFTKLTKRTLEVIKKEEQNNEKIRLKSLPDNNNQNNKNSCLRSTWQRIKNRLRSM